MSTHEERVRDEIAAKRAREEAARRETAGLSKWAKITRYVAIPGFIIPFIGIGWVLLFGFISMVLSIGMLLKGNPKDGIISMVIACLVMVLGSVASIAFNIYVIANSGSGI